MQSKLTIINRDPVALTFMLRNMGKKEFNVRLQKSMSSYPRFAELYLILENHSCWLMSKGQYRDNILFMLNYDEIPMYGWQVIPSFERRRKIK